MSLSYLVYVFQKIACYMKMKIKRTLKSINGSVRLFPTGDAIGTPEMTLSTLKVYLNSGMPISSHFLKPNFVLSLSIYAGMHVYVPQFITTFFDPS